jgi:hypothetical protein
MVLRALGSGICIAVLMAGGCESAKKTPPAVRPVRPAVKPMTVAAPVNEPVSLQAKTLAEQSQRDVQALLNGSLAKSESPGAADVAPVAPAPAARPAIIWNDANYLAQAKATSKSQEPKAMQPLARVAVESPPAMPQAKAQASDDDRGLPVEMPQHERVEQLIVDLSRELYASGAYSDAPLRELAVIASMTMIKPDRKLDPQAIPDLTGNEKQLLSELQNFFTELGTTLEKNQELQTAVASAAGSLRDSLVKPPQLSLPKAVLCTRVGGFGDYSPFERNSFLAASQQKVIVYLEIDEFVSELNATGEYVTQLAQQLTIYSDRDGIPVWKEDWQTAVDVSRNKRQDFFTVQMITFPQALSVGKYNLKVRVRDEKSSAETETTIPFEMVADPRMAAGK